MRALLVLVLLSACDGECSSFGNRFAKGFGHGSSFRSRKKCDLPVADTSFLAQSMDFQGSTGNMEIDIGGLDALDGENQVTVAFSFRRDLTGWPTGTHLFLNNNRSLARVFTIEANARGGNGEFRMALGDNIALHSAYAPDNTFNGQWMHHVCVSYDGTRAQASRFALVADGEEVTLQNVGLLPAAFPTAANSYFIGANHANGNEFDGQIANFAIWDNWAATTEECRTLWAENEGVDYRTLTGIPTPYFYCSQDPNACEITPTTPTGDDPAVSTEIPVDRRSVADTKFVERWVLNNGTEEWMNDDRGLYSASPSALVQEDGDLVLTYSQGTSHVGDHDGYIVEGLSRDLTFVPISNRPWPADAGNLNFADSGIGDLTCADSSKRSFTLSRLPNAGSGGGGQDLICMVINETQLEDGACPASPPRDRYIWTTCSDDDGDLSTGWSAPFNFGAAGVADGDTWNSVGRARIFPCSGGWCFGYYAFYSTSTRYDARLARSTDNGATWADWVLMAQDVVGGGGAEMEEPYVVHFDDDSDDACDNGEELVGLIRIDNGGGWTRDIVRVESTDCGVTWTDEVDVTDGWQHPVWACRSNGDCLLFNRQDGGGVAANAPCCLRKSTDRGETWSTCHTIDTQPEEGRCAQGDIWLTSDDRFGVIWAEDRVDSDTATRMEAGILSDCFVASMQ